MKTWLTYIVVSQLTGSPLLGIAVVLAVWFGGSAFWLGRLPDPTAPLRRWSRIRALRAELGMNPHNVDVRTELGGLLATRQPAEAKAILDEAVRRCPDLAQPAWYLGLARLELGDTEGGRTAIERALTLKPDLAFGEPLVRLGDHYARKGNPRAALTAYERATDIHCSYAEAWYKAGRAARAAGQLHKAKAHWTETLASTEHAPPFKRRLDRPWRWRAWWALRAA
jgi:tetratricopeptide (TPR) repeat protein